MEAWHVVNAAKVNFRSNFGGVCPKDIVLDLHTRLRMQPERAWANLVFRIGAGLADVAVTALSGLCRCNIDIGMAWIAHHWPPLF